MKDWTATIDHERDIITPITPRSGRIATGGYALALPRARAGRRRAIERICTSSQAAMAAPGMTISAVPRIPKIAKRAAPIIGPIAVPTVPPVT